MEGEADDEIINDIARVLSGSASAAEEEEDILDLTAELGGLELVGRCRLLDAGMIEMVEVVDVIAEAPARGRNAGSSGAGRGRSEPQPQPEAQALAVSAAPAPMSASDEAASALERAIAALRAGHVPTSMAEFMPQPEAQPPAFASQPGQPAEPEPEPAPEPEPELESRTGADRVRSGDDGRGAGRVRSGRPERARAEFQPGRRHAPWAGAPEPLVEPERPAARANGGWRTAPPSLDAAHKTLEDSVKDMLRPMLRQWLDENMPRVLTAALKDELGDSGARRPRRLEALSS